MGSVILGARTNGESRPDVSFLSWFSHLNPLLSTRIWTGLNNNSSIRRTRSILFPSETASSYTGHEADSTLHQLYREYQQALRPPGRKSPPS